MLQASMANLLERNAQVNGDGCGIGWHGEADEGERGEACTYRTVRPMWNNRTLLRLAENVSSPIFFGHVRVASPGSLGMTLHRVF
jgi:glutamine amidotransferase